MVKWLSWVVPVIVTTVASYLLSYINLSLTSGPAVIQWTCWVAGWIMRRFQS
jgi:Ca2+-dependent lipid-binding protein